MLGYTRTRHWALGSTWAQEIQSTSPHRMNLITCIYLYSYKRQPVIYGQVSQLIFQLTFSCISRFVYFSPPHSSCLYCLYTILLYFVICCHQVLCPGIFQVVRVPAMDRNTQSVSHDSYTPTDCARQFRVTNVVKPMFNLCFVWKMMNLRFYGAVS
jgi:hypothetical protein